MALTCGFPDHYSQLNIARDATAVEINEAFRRALSRSRRPWGSLFSYPPALLCAAHRELSVPDRRARYDIWLMEVDLLLSCHPPA